MNAKELRIGNLVNTTKGVAKIGIIDESINGEFCGIVSNDDESIYMRLPYDGEIQPIPLTEEWLLKFGFNKFPASNLWDRDDFWTLYYSTEKKKWIFDHLEMSIKYVHQLQNLYFALTGEELTA